MNENNKKSLVSIMAIAFLITLVGGATFAFFASTRDIDGRLPVNTQTAASMYSFTAVSNETIEFNVTAADMYADNVSENALKGDNANIYIELASASDEEITKCTYDIAWVWDSADTYTESDVELPYTKDGKTYPYELSITIDGKNETDLSNLTWNGNKAIVASGLEIKSSSKTPVKLTHNIEVKTYNLPVYQQKLFGKELKAHLIIENYSCRSGAIPKLSSGTFSEVVTNAVGQPIDLEDNGETYTGAIVNENGIRYEGKNPNNYVWFNDELWRIIGVFDENTHGRSGEQLVKLIKAESIGDYAWNDENRNVWNHASLKTTLNTSYYNNDGIAGIKSDAAREMIQPIYWKIGAHDTSSLTADVMYEKERGTTTPGASLQYGGSAVTAQRLPIGLMYPSDFGYAVLESDCARTISMYDYHNPVKCHTENWLWKSNIGQWTITPYTNDPRFVWYISTTINYFKHVGNKMTVFPVLYLKDGVKIESGKGTKASPYKLLPPSPTLLYHETCNDGSAACYIASKYTEDGVGGLYYHDGKGTYTNASLEDGDNSYRYSGQYSYPKASEGYDTYDKILIEGSWDSTNQYYPYTLAYDETNTKYTEAEAVQKALLDEYISEAVDNYLCFKEGCTDDEKYRIIGVIDEKLKIIKMTNDGNRVWNTNVANAEGNTNYWEGSSLEKYLNGEYLTNLNLPDNIIATTQWHVGGYTSWQRQLENASGIYGLELNSTPTIERKVGIMYTSDFMYAAEPKYWNLVGGGTDEDYQTSKGHDWMLTQDAEWIISRYSDEPDWAITLSTRYAVGYGVVSKAKAGVRPVFSLSSSAKIKSGSGTYDNPYIVA